MVIKKITNGTVTSPQGFTAGAAACGLKKSGNLDLALIYSERPCTAAGVFTRNEIAAAPVLVDRHTLAGGRTGFQGVAANAGNANACTGRAGLDAAWAMQQTAAETFGSRPEQWLVLSTGVIGVPLPLDKVTAGIQAASAAMSSQNGLQAAQAIMTTDTRPKHIAVELSLPAGKITIGGIAKGSGMIHPDMATMLAVITTDAAVPPDNLQSLLAQVVDRSFNCISVDGDTSTNDTVLLLANGAGQVNVSDEQTLACFGEGLELVCTELAKMIVRDGEGANKLAEIQVTGAFSPVEARAVAQTIATSPLVKTALAGGDANWGRILAAAGRAGVRLKPERLALWVGRPDDNAVHFVDGVQLVDAVQVVDGGEPTGYAESEAAAVFAAPEILIRLDLGDGQSQARMWTCDLTHEYVTINGDYRT